MSAALGQLEDPGDLGDLGDPGDLADSGGLGDLGALGEPALPARGCSPFSQASGLINLQHLEQDADAVDLPIYQLARRDPARPSAKPLVHVVPLAARAAAGMLLGSSSSFSIGSARSHCW